MDAVILAAGQGSRLRDVWDKPKGLLLIRPPAKVACAQNAPSPNALVTGLEIHNSGNYIKL